MSSGNFGELVRRVGEADYRGALPTRLRMGHYYRMALFMTYREVQLNNATAKGLEIQQLHILVLVVALV
jgi:hypothetical protein